jgi:GTP-binding protein
VITVLKAGFALSATEPKHWPPPAAPELAFCGRSNVGKSSCLNILSGKKGLARVSNTPGRTRLINFFPLEIAEKTRSGQLANKREVTFVDLPGYGYAKGSHKERESWKRMIETYLGQRETLRALLVLVDGELGPQPNDLELLGWAGLLGRPILCIATKLDRIPKTRRPQQLDKIAKALALPRKLVIGFSASEPFGQDEVWKAIVATLDEAKA